MKLRSVFILFTFLAVTFAADCSNDDSYTKIRQKDFKQGTYIIDTPGKYCLVEDVSFNPNSLATLQNSNPSATSYDSSDVRNKQFTFAGGIYDPSAYGIGFFAAIAISAKGVVLDLNGHTLEESEEHALQQRFYANIELADRPFIPGQGPHTFGTPLTPARNVVIRNGRLGRSSHHGIHGNDNTGVRLKNLEIVDWEVAAVALNHVTRLTVKNVYAASRKDVPITGRFSIGRFMRPYIDCMVKKSAPFSLVVNGVEKSVTDIQNDLKNALNNVFEDLITNDRNSISKDDHPDEYGLFHNKHGVVDGNAYGFLINSRGVAVNAFPFLPLDEAVISDDVLFSGVTLDYLAGDIQEIISLKNDAGNAQIGPVGAALQIFNRHPDTNELLTISSEDFDEAIYLGNPVSNAQAIIAKAKLAGWFGPSENGCRGQLDVSRSSINQATLDWIENSTPLSSLLAALPQEPLICNTDTMFHVNKGVIGFKLDGGANVKVENSNIRKIVNMGKLGSTVCNYDTTEQSHPLGGLMLGYNGADTRAFSFSGSQKAVVSNVQVEMVKSFFGAAIGVDIFGNSDDITCENLVFDDLFAGSQATSAQEFTGPNFVPLAHCHRIRNGATGKVVAPTCTRLRTGYSGDQDASTFVDDLFDTSVNA